jgi:predicted nuclease of restriction endonuclease-like (RecB) superfamily
MAHIKRYAEKNTPHPLNPLKSDIEKTEYFQVLLKDIHKLIEESRQKVSVTVNAALSILYWQVGDRINKVILDEKRAVYGKRILPTLSAKLAPNFGNGFSARNLARMIRFSETFKNTEIVVSLAKHLSWSHFVEIISIKDELKRDFYAEICRIERWNVRTLRKKINSMLFERTAVSKKPEELAKLEVSSLREEDILTPDLVFRDPYLLDFLGLTGAYNERDFEIAVLREMENFILELGIGFSFVARQKRITVGDEDFYLDLLFFHRKLKRLVAVELKLGKFKPAYKGQMELYLRWLEKYEREPGEETPLGLILCAGKSSEQVELLQLDKSGIKVAEYLTQLPNLELLKQRLHKAVVSAREQILKKSK